MIPAFGGPPCPRWEAARDADPVVRRYRAFFALLDWSQVPERPTGRPWPGSPPHPTAAYVKALLVKLCAGKAHVTQRRAFLLEPPLLVLERGCRPVPDAMQPLGFDVARTVPCDRWRRQRQQTLDHAALRDRLRGTVAALQAEIPGLGTTVAVDVKHIDAWVRENNPRERTPHRCDPARPPRGDPDCRLGAKRLANQDGPPDARAPAKEYLWGYGTGIATATDPRFGDVVLAELTQPFNHQDVTVYHPLHAQAAAALGRRPTNVAADAAFDAWPVDQTGAAPGGIAAIPRNRRGPAPARDPDGRPRGDRGLAMAAASRFVHEDGFRAQRYRCPLLWPARSGEPGDHAQFAKGPGCTKYTNIEAGGRMRAELDRPGEPDRSLYRQRTSAERINRQAKALGIERPKVRPAAAVHRLNTLTDVVSNARALHRARALNAAHPPPPTLC